MHNLGLAERVSTSRDIQLQSVRSHRGTVNPTEEFLLETLIPGTRLHSRNGTSYVSARRWHKSIRAHQIKAMCSVKRQPTGAFVSQIAQELIDVVERVIGMGAFSCVIPIPPGSSGQANALSVQIANTVAEACGLVCHPRGLVAGDVSLGRSHPRKSQDLRPYRLGSDIVGPALLVDDVVTSGRHLELARLALIPRPVFSIAWIGA